MSTINDIFRSVHAHISQAFVLSIIYINVKQKKEGVKMKNTLKLDKVDTRMIKQVIGKDNGPPGNWVSDERSAAQVARPR